MCLLVQKVNTPSFTQRHNYTPSTHIPPLSHSHDSHHSLTHLYVCSNTLVWYVVCDVHLRMVCPPTHVCPSLILPPFTLSTYH